jgi:hypothetical protein
MGKPEAPEDAIETTRAATAVNSPHVMQWPPRRCHPTAGCLPAKAVCGGDSRLSFRLQPQLYKPADGFGSNRRSRADPRWRAFLRSGPGLSPLHRGR